MTKRNDRGLKAAVEAASLSVFRRHRVGAALFYKNRLVNIGWNRKKSHPQCPTERSQHAEFNVFIGIASASKCTLYVAMLTRSGDVGIAKPCEICERYISGMGITKVFYTNRDGRLEQLEF
jgi:deoxycytidylate deaminase